MKNRYSETWFELFLDAPDERQTGMEVDFLARQLPRERCRTVLDVCCGYGRHAGPFGEQGYDVVAIDRDPAVIETARQRHGAVVDFQVRDMTRVRDVDRRFDAVICMWQSFGYFDSQTNRDVLSQMAGLLDPGGRLIIDIYNAAFFVARQGTRTSVLRGVEIVTTQRLEDDRLHVDLDYGDGRSRDLFEWQVFTPGQFAEEARAHGLHPIVACTAFDEGQAPSADTPRMQLVLEKGRHR